MIIVTDDDDIMRIIMTMPITMKKTMTKIMKLTAIIAIW